MILVAHFLAMRAKAFGVGIVPALVLMTLLSAIAARAIHRQPGFALEVPHHAKHVGARDAQQAYYSDIGDDYGYPPPYGPVTSDSATTETVCKLQ